MDIHGQIYSEAESGANLFAMPWSVFFEVWNLQEMPFRLIGGYHPADEMYRIHILAAAALMTVFSASCDSCGPEVPDPLEEIGEYVFDRPDSALNALSEISPSQLETRE